MIHDGHGNPAGQRPGFLYSDGMNRTNRRASMLIGNMTKPFSERWRRATETTIKTNHPTAADIRQSGSRPSLPPMREYDRTIQERWRK